MRKLILSLGLLAAFALPAAAQSAYDESAANVAAGANSGVEEPPAASPGGGIPLIDDMRTGSISTMSSDQNGSDKQRGDQGAFFGTNSR